MPARIYRTWASLLTQIQGGYVAATMYRRVDMSADLDYAGIDMRIVVDDAQSINVQVKKETMSREVRALWKTDEARRANHQCDVRGDA